MTPLSSFVAFQNLLFLVLITVFAAFTCKGKPWGFIYLFFGLMYLAFGAHSIAILDIVVDTQTQKELIGVGPVINLDALKREVESLKLVVPVISIGIGCSMVTNFLSATKPKP